MAEFMVRAAKDAQASGYGDESYWQYLEDSGREMQAAYVAAGDSSMGDWIVSRSLSEALRGNDGA